MPVRWVPPEAELAIGLARYVTGAPGTGGRIKEDPEDFRVDEISLYPMPDPEGAYTVLRVSARNWEQHELVRRLSDRLRLRPGALAWAGTKDRRAVTEQLLTYAGPPPEPGAVELPGVEVREVYRARRGVVLGHHYGNAFGIRVRGVGLAPRELADRVAAISSELRAVGRIPDAFGPQRVGEVRPVTHLVGRELVRGDPEAAVRIYLTLSVGAEAGEAAEARRSFAAHGDPLRALREFPAAYRFERSILDHLARGQDPARALGALPRELRRLFIHAYQALLFNRYLAERARTGLSLTEPTDGDRLLRVARDGTVPGTDPIPVSRDNQAETEELVRRGRAVLAGPLVGTETPVLSGEPGRLVEHLLAADGVRRSMFALPRTPDLASDGTWRPLTVALPPIAVRVPAGPLPGARPEGASEYSLGFALPKGAYATVLLREFLKDGARPAE